MSTSIIKILLGSFSSKPASDDVARLISNKQTENNVASSSPQKSPRYLDIRSFSVSLKPSIQDSFDQQPSTQKLQNLVSSLISVTTLQKIFGKTEDDLDGGSGENRKRSESIKSTRTDTDQGINSKIVNSFQKSKRVEDMLQEVKSKRKRLLDERLSSIKTRLLGH